jgi:hypothetical protein
MIRGFVVIALLGGALVACSGSSSSSCASCVKLAACCVAEAAVDGGLPGARCTSQGDVTSNNAQSASCSSDPGIVQGDANTTCASDLAKETALAGSPSACQ